MRRNNHRNDSFVDVLILHGRDLDFCKKLIGVLDAVGLRAKRVEELPTVKKEQDRNVEHYIQSCGVPVVLVTFDEAERGSSKARANVYDELRRCRDLRKKDFVVLQEQKNGRLVDLPSNISGGLPTPIEFDRLKPYELLRDLFAAVSDSHHPFSLSTASVLRSFMDGMDQIWEQGFDKAWEIIHPRDTEAERNFGLALDKFFQSYQTILRRSVTEKPRTKTIKKACNDALDDAYKYLSEAWAVAAKSTFDSAQWSGASKDVRSKYDEAAKENRRITKSADHEEKIKQAKHVVELLVPGADLGKLSSIKKLKI